MHFELSIPITRDEVTITAVRIFRPRAEDMRVIVEAEGAPGGEMAASMATIARLTDLPGWAIEQLSYPDVLALGSATDAMFAGKGRH
jgi:hypothetical protein